MTRPLEYVACAGLALFAATVQAAGDTWSLPIRTHTLDNGLTVVVSEDHTSPTVGVSVVYGIGMRREPQGRTGFAHLFEHMMFQGTPTAPKGVFDQVIQGGGGVLNGSTRADYTNYIEAAPVSALEPILWLEADRMRTLDFSAENLKNQQDVVKEEIRVNVKNQPYGLFFWTDIARLAFAKWENAHDGYGSFADLEGAACRTCASFHRDYYGPNNAVIGIVGRHQGRARVRAGREVLRQPAGPTRPEGHRPGRAAQHCREAREPDRCARPGAGRGARVERTGAAQPGPGADGRAVAAAAR